VAREVVEALQGAREGARRLRDGVAQRGVRGVERHLDERDALRHQRVGEGGVVEAHRVGLERHAETRDVVLAGRANELHEARVERGLAAGEGHQVPRAGLRDDGLTHPRVARRRQVRRHVAERAGLVAVEVHPHQRLGHHAPRPRDHREVALDELPLHLLGHGTREREPSARALLGDRRRPHGLAEASERLAREARTRRAHPAALAHRQMHPVVARTPTPREREQVSRPRGRREEARRQGGVGRQRHREPHAPRGRVHRRDHRRRLPRVDELGLVGRAIGRREPQERDPLGPARAHPRWQLDEPRRRRADHRRPQLHADARGEERVDAGERAREAPLVGGHLVERVAPAREVHHRAGEAGVAQRHGAGAVEQRPVGLQRHLPRAARARVGHQRREVAPLRRLAPREHQLLRPLGQRRVHPRAHRRGLDPGEVVLRAPRHAVRAPLVAAVVRDDHLGAHRVGGVYARTRDARGDVF
jgi:hypothetical protein